MTMPTVKEAAQLSVPNQICWMMFNTIKQAPGESICDWADRAAKVFAAEENMLVNSLDSLAAAAYYNRRAS